MHILITFPDGSNYIHFSHLKDISLLTIWLLYLICDDILEPIFQV